MAGLEFLWPILLSALLSAFSVIIGDLISRVGTRRVRQETLSQRVQKSISKLSKAFGEIDGTFRAITEDIKNREVALEELKATQHDLLKEEKDLKKRVESLKKVPSEAAEYFEQMTKQTLQEAERKRTRRDIIMFFLGIIVTTVINIILRGVGLM